MVEEFEILLFDMFFVGIFSGNIEVVDWVVMWLFEGGDLVMESYVNFIFIV